MTSPIIIDDVDQGTPEWKALRLGIPTASNFHRILTEKKLDLSTKRFEYMDELLAERLTGMECARDVSNIPNVIRGNTYEAEAREHYRKEYGKEVRQVAFIYRDENRNVGCSPDGLVGDALFEIKNPTPTVHVRTMRTVTMPAKYALQVQAQLWCAHASRAWYYSYLSDAPETAVRIPVDRDPRYQRAFDATIPKFIAELEAEAKRVLF